MKPTIRRLAELGADERDRLTHRSLDRIFDPELWASVRSIYEDVAAAGDGALCAALQRFDGVDATAGDLRVSEAELDGAGAKLAPELRDALDSMVTALRAYNERVLRDADWREEIAPGVIVGERSRPIASAAIYVPCGKGSFPSVMAHLGVPAAVAGVPQVVVLTPPLRTTGRVDPAYLYIAAQLGLREVWRVNGPSGIAAAALGSSSIPRVRKIVGPGSPAVTVAQLLGVEHGVATNMLQGPSESLILADDSADPVLLALDLLTEAEHGADSAATLVTWSEELAEAVAAAVEPRLAALPQAQREYASATLTDLGGILICADEAEACAFANAYAVEHLQIATADPRGHARANRARRRDPDRPEHAHGGRQLHDRRAQHAALGRLRGRLERRDRAHVPGHELAGRAERRGAGRRRPCGSPDRRVRALSRARPGRQGAWTVSERGTVALMPTCLVDLVRPEAGVAAVRVLRRAGYRVTFPEGQTCCGQPAWNSGFPDDARRVAATTLDALADSEGPIVVLSGSCAATMLHAWPELFAGRRRASRACWSASSSSARCSRRSRARCPRRAPADRWPSTAPATSGAACATRPRAPR